MAGRIMDDQPTTTTTTITTTTEIRCIVWFPSESECPSCGSYDTRATCTRADLRTQYRTCRQCHRRYKMGGQLVRIPPDPEPGRTTER